jgi:hypothetical protein
LHILPELKYLEQKYKDSLTVIGVHSANLTTKKKSKTSDKPSCVTTSTSVLVDSGFKIWQEYAVRAWPTLMVIDPQGYVIGYVSGEGNRDILDQLIEQVIREHQQKAQLISTVSLTLEKQRKPWFTPLAFPGKVLATSVGLFIADSGHHRIVVSSLDGEVLHLIGTGKPGLTDGRLPKYSFLRPRE